MSAKTGLRGPFPLTTQGINAAVPHKIGAYALGYMKDGTFYVKRVGRSDNDTNDRLHDYIALGRYSVFKFELYGTPQTAFLKECELFHNFDPPDNDAHPDSPDGTNLDCPWCARRR